MSSEADNAENLRILLRAIPEEVFSFVIVQCNHASFVSEIEIAINSKYPNRKIQKVSYPLPSNKTIGILAEEMGEGVLMVTNFEEILKDQNSWRVFNQTRDQVSSFQISLIVFIPITPSVTQFMIQNMRDFWSIRNLVVEFWKEPTVKPVLLMDPFLEHSTDANLSKEEKEVQLSAYSRMFELDYQDFVAQPSKEDPWQLIARHIKFIRFLFFAGKNSDAVHFLERINSVAPNEILYIWLGRAQIQIYEYEQAKKNLLSWQSYWSQTLTQHQQMPNIEISMFEAQLNLVALFTLIGDQNQAYDYLELARKNALRNASKTSKARFYNFEGLFNLRFNDEKNPSIFFSKAIHHLPPDGDQLARNMLVSNLAEAYLVSGDYYTAYETAYQAYQEVHKIGDLYLESILLFQLGRIKVAQGLPELGKPHLQEAIRISQYLGSPKLPIMEKFVQTIQA